MQIFGQVWLWSLGSFLLGALFTWLLLVRPARKRVAELEEMASRRPEQPPTRVEQPIGRPPNPDKFLDDLFETQKAAAAQRAANLPPLPAPPPPPIPSGPPITAPPGGIQGRLDAAPGPTAPPEPPIPDDSETELSDNPFRSFAESTTVFVPPSNLPKPPESIEPSGEDWFAKEDGQDPHLITDVEDDEQVDEGGTIFTQHTTPIPAEMIRSLDETPPPRATEQSQVPPESAAEQTQVYDTPPVPAQAEHGQRHSDDAAQQAAEQSRHDAEALQQAAEQSRYDIAAQQMAAEQSRYDAAAQQMAAEQSRYDSAAQQAAEQSRYDAAAQQMAAEQERYDSLAQPEQAQYDPAAQQAADQERYAPAAHSADQQAADQGRYAAAAAHSAEPQVSDQSHYDSLAQPLPSRRDSYAAPAPQPAAEPEPSRSLFEPVVPVAEESNAADDFVPPGPFGPGSAMPLPGGGSPAPEFNVKASVTALRYCTQDNPQFDRIVAEVWFRTPSDAERVGFRVLS